MSIKDYTRYIVINGYEYEINMRQTTRDLGCMGDMDKQLLVIRVASDLHAQQQQSTVLHEILEAIKEHNELDLSHAALCTLEAALFDTLTRNGVSLKPLLEPNLGE